MPIVSTPCSPETHIVHSLSAGPLKQGAALVKVLYIHQPSSLHSCLPVSTATSCRSDVWELFPQPRSPHSLCPACVSQAVRPLQSELPQESEACEVMQPHIPERSSRHAQRLPQQQVLKGCLQVL